MKKVIFISIAIALLSITMISACSQPAQPAAATKPAAASETPKTPAPATPPAAPVQQPQQPVAQPQQPVEKPTSFESALYTNDKYGFSIKYPKKWVKKDATGDMVFWITSTEQMTADVAFVRVIPKTADYAKAIKESLDQYPGFQGLTAGAKFDSSGATTLPGTKTPAFDGWLTFKVMMYTAHVYGLAVDKGDNTIIAVGATVGEAQDLVKEIAQTLTLK
jgi:hypothetical protein